jgi:YegS/Rv2252/BmrU family lipid kinase
MTQGGREAALIINTASRRGRDRFEHARERLRAGGFTLRETHAVRRPKHTPAIVSEAIARGATTVILGGGDGTVTSVAGLLAHRDIVLGLLPIGTGNSFARGLKLPLALDGAIDTILHGRVARVDLATANGVYFANAASIGLSTAVGRNTPALLKRVVGPFAYVIQGIRETAASRAFRFAFVDAQGKRTEGATQQIVVTNGPIFGTTAILPDATLTDGTLAVYAIRGARRIEIAKMWLGMLAGGLHTRLETAEFFHTSRLEITTVPRRTVDIDGELRLRTPVRFHVEPEALRVFVPHDAQP